MILALQVLDAEALASLLLSVVTPYAPVASRTTNGEARGVYQDGRGEPAKLNHVLVAATRGIEFGTTNPSHLSIHAAEADAGTGAGAGAGAGMGAGAGADASTGADQGPSLKRTGSGASAQMRGGCGNDIRAGDSASVGSDLETSTPAAIPAVPLSMWSHPTPASKHMPCSFSHGDATEFVSAVLILHATRETPRTLRRVLLFCVPPA